MIFAVVAIQHDRDEPRSFRLIERGLVLLTFLLGMALVFAANYVYWTTPGDNTVNGVQARYFVPLLVLIPVMVGTPRARWLGAREARFPLAAPARALLRGLRDLGRRPGCTEAGIGVPTPESEGG